MEGTRVDWYETFPADPAAASQEEMSSRLHDAGKFARHPAAVARRDQMKTPPIVDEVGAGVWERKIFYVGLSPLY